MVNDAPILVVEDEPNDVLLLQRAFRKAALTHPVQIVADGEAAVDYLAGRHDFANREQYPLPKLMLLDLKLPRKSGLEVLAWVREQPGLRRLPVVVLTSSKETSDIARAYDLGVNSYLVKPAAFDSLLEMIKAVAAYWLTHNEAPTLSDR